MTEGLLGDIASRRSELEGYSTEVLRKIVRIPTVNPPGQNYRVALEAVANELRNFSFESELIETPDAYVKEKQGSEVGLAGQRVNLVARTTKGKPRLVLNAHMDTVPPGSNWTKDPFGAETKDGTVYGRGAADDKSGVTLLVVLARMLKELHVPAPPMLITVTIDEEIGGEAGVGYLVNKGKITGEFFLTADGPAEFIVAYHNGIYRFNLVTEGKAAHASMPFKGVSAIEDASRVVLGLQEYQRELLKRRSKYAASPDLVEQGFKTLYPSANIGVIRGGVKVNVVPDSCELEVERRFTPEEDGEEVKREVVEVLEGVKNSSPRLKYSIREVSFKDAARTDPAHPFVKKIQEAANKVYKKVLPIAGTTGATDMSFTTNLLKMPSAGFGPIRSDEKIHGADEFVRIRDIVDAASVYSLVMSSLS